jgi:chemotaxis protein methyltransferase CheR
VAGEVPFDPTRLRRIAQVVTDELGIRMPDIKLTMLHGRLQRRLRELGLSSLKAYEARLHDPTHATIEQVALFDLATTNKTDFFREPAHFDYLVDRVLPDLAAGRSSWNLRLWCAGCSSGQEAYTLAMVLAEYARTHPGFDFSILGTDISARVLRQAASGTYHADLVEPVPAAIRQRYVMRGKGERAGQVRIVPELRAKIRLQRLNFMDERYDVPKEFDVVFFRNVLIYFEREVQQRVVSRQCKHLRSGGYLFVAHTESLTGLDVPLVPRANSVFQRRP